jgi:sigma-B regulation protein RsbU (phosphoserine phosphatase)
MPESRKLTPDSKYELLRDISFRIRRTFDLEEILNHLLDTVKTIVPYDAAGIFVLNQPNVLTRYRQAHTLIAGIVQRGFDRRPPETDSMLTHGKGVVGHVIKSGECLVVPDVRQDPHYVEGRSQTRSEIAVPLVEDGVPYGALNLESDTLRAFDESDIEILRFLADAASMSIEKSMLHDQILEKNRIQDQLSIAREVQERLLPAEPPRVAGYDIAGVCLPTYEIGGDYFDYLPLDEERIGIVVADVAGNGIPAALLMTAFRTLLRTSAKSYLVPSELLESMNKAIPGFMRKRDFISVFFGILDPRAHRLLYANAGHNLPLVLRSDGSMEVLPLAGPALNLIESPSFATGTVPVHEKDCFVLYTDGVVEVFDQQGSEFGVERLRETVRLAGDLSAGDILERVVAATADFAGTATAADDSTIVVIKRDGPKAPRPLF